MVSTIRKIAAQIIFVFLFYGELCKCLYNDIFCKQLLTWVTYYSWNEIGNFILKINLTCQVKFKKRNLSGIVWLTPQTTNVNQFYFWKLLALFWARLCQIKKTKQNPKHTFQVDSLCRKSVPSGPGKFLLDTGWVCPDPLDSNDLQGMNNWQGLLNFDPLDSRSLGHTGLWYRYWSNSTLECTGRSLPRRYFLSQRRRTLQDKGSGPQILPHKNDWLYRECRLA